MVGREEGDDLGGDELHEHGHDEAEPSGDDNGIAQGALGPLRLAGPDVLGTQGGDGGEHGGGDQEKKADDLFHDAHGSRIRQPAPVGDDGDDEKADLDQAVLEGDGDADA